MSSPELVWAGDNQGPRLLLSFCYTILNVWLLLLTQDGCTSSAIMFNLSQEEGGVKRRRAYALPLNTFLGSHILHLCSHLIDLINLVTYPYLAARKDLGKAEFISAKIYGYFHWKRNGDQVLQNHFFSIHTD